MRSRTIREGAVGLFILLALGVLGAVVLWLRGIATGGRSYEIFVEFDDVGLMQAGAPVRYRGVPIGRVLSIEPEVNKVVATLEVEPASVIVPRDSIIAVNETGLVGETGVDITPLAELPTATKIPLPTSSKCDSELIICDRDRLAGEVGVSYQILVRSLRTLSDTFVGDQAFLENIKRLIRNTADASGSIAQLGREATVLTQSVNKQLGTLGQAGVSTVTSVRELTDRVNQTVGNVDRLILEANALLNASESNLMLTLANVTSTTTEVRLAAASIESILAGVDAKVAQADVGTFFEDLKRDLDNISTDVATVTDNLSTASGNLSTASGNLAILSELLADPSTLVMLQQTLGSARTTFENAQKLTSDFEELLGDPEFRNNLRRLIEGLSELVSLGEQLEQQTIVAYELAPLAEALQAARPIDPAPTHEAVHEAAPKLVKQDAAEVSPAMPQWMAPE